MKYAFAIAALVFISSGKKQPPPYHYTVNNNKQATQPDTAKPPLVYYNLYGYVVKRDSTGKTGIKIVLAGNNKKATVEAAIKNGHVINVPNDMVLNMMTDIFERTRLDGKERKFKVGESGLASMIVVGSQKEVSAEKDAAALQDLIKKGDTYSYSVHSHPEKINESEKTYTYGVASPSEADSLEATRDGHTQPNVVLGYLAKYPPNFTKTGAENQIPPDYIKQIGFYNEKGEIIRFDFSFFSSTVKKLNKQKK